MIKYKDLKKYIEHFRLILKRNWNDPCHNQGMIIIFKDKILKKSNTKKMAVIIVGDDLKELQRNFSKISQTYEFFIREFMKDFKFENGGIIN